MNDAGLREELALHAGKTKWEAVLRTLEIRAFQTVHDLCTQPTLDLGCGDGFVAKMAFGRLLEVGLDLDLGVLEQARLLTAYRLLVNADARVLPFKNSAFRSVYTNGAMEHMDDLDSVLSEISRVLMRGGVLVTLVPSDRFLESIGSVGKLLGRGMWARFNQLHNHVNLLSRDDWCARMAKWGLAVDQVTTYGGPKIAAFIANRDLLSKLHLSSRRPFIQLRHQANLGRWLPELLRPSILGRQNGPDECPEPGSGHAKTQLDKMEGYWMLIVARRK